MTGQNVGYIRVSAVDQNPERQLAGVELDRFFTDHASGSTRKRPQLEACLKHLRQGDVLHVHSIDRLARNLSELQKIVEELTGAGVAVEFHKENLSFKGTPSPMEKLLFQVMGAFAEFERSLIRERQREGQANAKAKGKQIGRPPALSPQQETEAKKRIANGESVSALARELGVSRGTLYSLIPKKHTP